MTSRYKTIPVKRINGKIVLPGESPKKVATKKSGRIGNFLAAIGLTGALLGGAGLYVYNNPQYVDMTRDLLGRIATTEKKQEKTLEDYVGEHSHDNDKTFVVNSSAYPGQAEFLAALLTNKGYHAHTKTARVNGKSYSRTVIFAKPENLEETIRRYRSEKPIGTDGYFLVDKKGRILKSVGTQKEVELEKTFFEYENRMTKDEYVSMASTYIQKANRWAKPIKGQKVKRYNEAEAEHIAELIFKYCRKYELPLIETTAIFSTESSFGDQAGDHQLGRSKLAEGLGQIRKPTQRYVYNLLKRDGDEEAPDQMPKTLLNNPPLQVLFVTRYFKDCLDKAGGSLDDAIGRYNAGHNANGKKNTRYISDVLLRAASIARHYRNSSP